MEYLSIFLVHLLVQSVKVFFKKKPYHLLKTMVGVNEVSCKNHLLSGSCCGLKVYRCTAPNATGFPLLSLILGFHILTLGDKAQLFYSAPASLSDLIPKGDLVLTEWFFLFQQHSLWKWIEKDSFIIPYLAGIHVNTIKLFQSSCVFVFKEAQILQDIVIFSLVLQVTLDIRTICCSGHNLFCGLCKKKASKAHDQCLQNVQLKCFHPGARHIYCLSLLRVL